MSRRYSIDRSKFLDDKEVERLEKSCRKHIDHQMALIILIGLRTGARASEILLLTGESLNRQEVNGEDICSLFIKATKKSRDREVPIPLWLYEEMKKRVDGDKKLFPVNRHSVCRAWRDYTPNRKKGFHSLRHTVGVRLYRATKDMDLVKSVLGHVEIQNTQIYVDYVRTLDEMSDAMKKLG